MSRWRIPRSIARAVVPQVVLMHLLALPLPARLTAARDGGAVPPPDEVATALAAWRRGGEEAAVVRVLDPVLAWRIDELRATSPTFAEAWRELERSGTPVVVATREQVEEYLPRFVRDSRVWAGVTVTWGDRTGRLERSAVVIRLEWLRGLRESFGAPEAAFLEILDGLLIHEVYGHLVPVVEAGSVRVRCPDPAPRERLADSCVGRRELEVKAERAATLAATAAEGGLPGVLAGESRD